MGYDNTAAADMPAFVGHARRTAHAWAVSMRLIAQYFAYRAGLCPAPRLTDHWPPVQLFFRQITRMDARIAVRGIEHCPQQHPAVFACNHVKLDDPFFVCHAVQTATRHQMHTRFVMRDDYFKGPPWDYLPLVDVNEIAQLGGGYLVALDRVQLSQLKPIVDVLLQPFSFAIFPGRTRSRSGLIMDWRDGYGEPAAVSFFVAQAQRKRPGLRVPVTPIARTHNPATGMTAMILGAPLHLPEGADRETQRAFDYAVVDRIGALVEIHVLHAVCVIAYLRALHGRPEAIARGALAAAVHRVLDALEGRHIDPAAHEDFERSLEAALAYLERCRMLDRGSGALRFGHAAILALPPMDTRFRTRNPVRFLCNQVLHFQDLSAAAEREALRG